MTVLAEDMITFLTGTTAITGLVGTRVHYNRIPQISEKPHIWFATASDQQDPTFDGVGSFHDANIDLECVADNESSAQSIADAVTARLDGHQGALGNIRAQGIFLQDKDDNYFPKSIDADDGRHVVAYDVRVLYST
jgi:hypothetical protein